jgi:LAS superfamily LD-carboxypeptidase LdcB
VTSIISHEQILGLNGRHVATLEPGWRMGECALHPFAIAALEQLRHDARAAGFDLRVVSGFRSFMRQAEIWNAKAAGLRPVLDANEQPIDTGTLSERELVFAILRWSALPGASRHHWGSDMDVVDAAAIPPGYALRLSVDETRVGGPFAPLHRWLGERIAAGRAHGFFRPYTGAGCDVAPEPWHLSFAPLAWECQRAFDPAALRRAHRDVGLALQPVIEDCCEEILGRYFQVSAALYASARKPDTVVEVIT